MASESDDSGFSEGRSAVARAGLELAPDEAVRVLATAGRAILLERGNAGGVAVPGDRDLVLSCDVRAFDLADLLSLLHGASKSGLLLFQFEKEEKTIYLSRGEVVFAESNLSTDRLGASLLRAGRLDQGQLELAENRYHPLTRFGKVVVELGMLTPRDLWNGVKRQVEEIVRSLFSYTGGWVHFWEGEIEPDNVVRLSLPTKRLIAEGLAKRDDLLRDLAMLEDRSTRIVRGRESRTPTSDNERAVLAALDASERFVEITRRSDLDSRTAARTLQFLQLTDHVLVERDEPFTPEAAQQDDEAIREEAAIHAKLICELSAPLIALDGAAAVAERLNRIAEESAENGRTLLEAVRFDARATLDPERLADRALQLPGDRLRALDEALGEIVAYLEFELRNHPRIEDHVPFLEAVDPIRATLER